jgi:putative ABC transport system permease protein
MQAEVKAGKLPDLTVYTNALDLTPAKLAALGRLPNIRGVEPHSYYSARAYVGARRAPAYVLGVRDYADQSADVVHVVTGRAPGDLEVLSEAQNANQGLLDAHAGDTLRLVDARGTDIALRVTGEGRNLNGGKDATDDDVIVLYGTPETVSALSGVFGYSALAFRLDDARPAAVASTVALLRRTLPQYAGFTGFTGLPEIREPGSWPGRDDFQSFSDFFYVITVLALLSALVLIANTMSTLVAEQTGEIGSMKAIGGRRRQIAGVYVRTAMLLGAVGTLAGIVLGIALSNVLVRYLGSTFFAIDVGFGVDWTILAISVLVGVLGPALAALPAIRRATRVPLREALEASGSAVGTLDAGDRWLRRIRFLPRTAQIGLRNVGRRRRRSLATMAIVALAVGNLLAIMGLAAGITATTHAEWNDHGEDVKITSEGGRGLDEAAAGIIGLTPGVATVEPMFVREARLAGEEGYVWAVQPRTMFRYHLADGRWYTAVERRARVAVVERNIARITGTHVGDRISVDTAAGPVDLRVIGIATNQQENGTAIFVPLTTMQRVLRSSAGLSFWIRFTSHDHPFVDRTTTAIEDALSSSGYGIGTEIEYVGEADNVAANRTITTSIAVLGFLIVAISMVGLANALTMSVIERTREIGILRTIGARGRDVRRIFAAESVALAAGGWLIGIPVGWALDHMLVWLVKEEVNVVVPFTFPAWNVVAALAGTVLLALVITYLPIRRAVRYRPGRALRYA